MRIAGHRSSSGLLLATALALLFASATAVRGEMLVFHGSESGKQTLDGADGGGNPFASALIEALDSPVMPLADLPAVLRRLTRARSDNLQTPDVPDVGASQRWLLTPAAPGERRRALVLVVADYRRADGVRSLPGARTDAQRIAMSLRRAGFATDIALDHDLAGMRARLAEFAAASAGSDAAVIYVTGHGVEAGGKIYLLPGDYPVAEGNAALLLRAMALGEIGRALRARRINLLFYGGCRDDPLR